MKTQVPTPHRRIIAYLIFRHGNVEDCLAELRALGFSYLYDAASMRQEIERMRSTMPLNLSIWHSALPDALLLPPDEEEARQWLTQWEILPFYEQLMVRAPDKIDQVFHDAWNLFKSTTHRHSIEAMRLCGTDSAEIAETMGALRYQIDLAAVDYYFANFFVDQELYPEILYKWVEKISNYAENMPLYAREAASKIHAVLTPLDKVGALAKLNILINMDQKYILLEMRMRTMERANTLADSVQTARLTDEEMKRETEISNVLARLSRTLDSSLRTEKICELVESKLYKGNRLRALTIKEIGIKTRAELMAEQPPPPVKPDGGKVN